MNVARSLSARRIAAAEDAALRLLIALGEDPDREGLSGTPRRVAQSLLDLTDGYGIDPRAVVGGALYETEGHDPVTVRNIAVYSMCEHHLLPMFGRCHVSYVPDGKIIGLSKLGRLVDVFAHRLQVQERLTRQIAEAVDEVLAPRGVAVHVQARHLCMEMRGVEKAESDTVTYCLLGEYRTDDRLRAEFMELTRNSGR